MLRKNVLRYQPVAGRDLGDGEVAVNAAGDADGAEEFEDRDRRFDDIIKKDFPLRAVGQALALLGMGVFFLVLALLQHHGHVDQSPSSIAGLAFLGVLSFAPGFYATRIAYYSWKGARGYSYHQIPET